MHGYGSAENFLGCLTKGHINTLIFEGERISEHDLTERGLEGKSTSEQITYIRNAQAAANLSRYASLFAKAHLHEVPDPEYRKKVERLLNARIATNETSVQITHLRLRKIARSSADHMALVVQQRKQTAHMCREWANRYARTKTSEDLESYRRELWTDTNYGAVVFTCAELGIDFFQALSNEEKAPFASKQPYIRMGSNQSAPKLSVYYSLGCVDCVEFLDRHIDVLRSKADLGMINIALLNWPARYSFLSTDRRIAAAETNALVAEVTHCIGSQKDADVYLASLKRLFGLAQHNIGPIDTDRHPWSWYINASDHEMKGDAFSSISELVKSLYHYAGVNPSECSDADYKVYLTQTNYEMLRSVKPESLPAIKSGESLLYGDKIDLEVNLL